VGQLAKRQIEPMNTAMAPLIAADVGGTHARVGLVRAADDGRRVAVLAYRKYACADYPNLETILRDFVDSKVQTPVHRCAVACAGVPIDGVVVNTNLPWPVSVAALREHLGLADLALINDFEAVAHATRFIDAASSRRLAGPECGEGPIVVVGPGTGLGSAVSIPADQGPVVLPTEAGQINLAPVTKLDRDVLARLAADNNYVPYEQVLSGPGLVVLYRELAQLQGAAPTLTEPEAITDAALAGDDAVAVETLDLFCAWLGSFVGNLVMLHGAAGGVYLTGGIVPRISEFLERSAFMDRFLDKGRMRAFLERVPVRLLEHGRLGVIGAAAWAITHSGDRDRSAVAL
jgi:glucokinase